MVLQYYTMGLDTRRIAAGIQSAMPEAERGAPGGVRWQQGGRRPVNIGRNACVKATGWATGTALDPTGFEIPAEGGRKPAYEKSSFLGLPFTIDWQARPSQTNGWP